MLFNSFIFLGLLLITFLLYYFVKSARSQIGILVISSLIFYAYDQPGLVILLLFSAGLNITISYYIANDLVDKKKQLAIFGVLLNLAVLAFFKYNPLFSKSILEQDSSIGRFFLNIPLPIGISFFTFEGISLLVDVYSGKNFDNKKLIPKSFREHALHTLFFISFFPHLVAGPILKAHDFYPQIGVKKIMDIKWEMCFKHLLIGYFLKMVVADNLKDFTFFIAYPYFEIQSTLTLVAMLFGYSFQIFADFAGYSLIAIGLAKLFGYDFNENFNFPYISSSFKEFWKRWHISLSSFLMEYLYFPLGGNRKGKARTYINLMITMILGGLWHGAAWSYAVWGAFHGIALALERFILDKITIRENDFIKIVKTLFVFCLVTLAWLLFKLPVFDHVIKYLESIANNTKTPNDYHIIAYIIVYSSPVVFYHFSYLLKTNNYYENLRNHEYVAYALMLFLIVTNSGSSGSFIYFQF